MTEQDSQNNSGQNTSSPTVQKINEFAERPLPMTKLVIPTETKGMKPLAMTPTASPVQSSQAQASPQAAAATSQPQTPNVQQTQSTNSQGK